MTSHSPPPDERHQSGSAGDSIAVPLSAEEASPATARAHISRLLKGRASVDDRGVAELITSELVTNAVMHGREPIRLEAHIDEHQLHINVFDADPDTRAVASQSRQPAAAYAGGRGLRIIAVLAQRWGVIAAADGKRVWATLTI